MSNSSQVKLLPTITIWTSLCTATAFLWIGFATSQALTNNIPPDSMCTKTISRTPNGSSLTKILNFRRARTWNLLRRHRREWRRVQPPANQSPKRWVDHIHRPQPKPRCRIAPKKNGGKSERRNERLDRKLASDHPNANGAQTAAARSTHARTHARPFPTTLHASRSGEGVSDRSPGGERGGAWPPDGGGEAPPGKDEAHGSRSASSGRARRGDPAVERSGVVSSPRSLPSTVRSRVATRCVRVQWQRQRGCPRFMEARRGGLIWWWSDDVIGEEEGKWIPKDPGTVRPSTNSMCARERDKCAPLTCRCRGISSLSVPQLYIKFVWHL